MKKITKNMIMGDIIRNYPSVVEVLLASGMYCLGCPSSQLETLEDACGVHGLDSDKIENNLNAFLDAQ